MLKRLKLWWLKGKARRLILAHDAHYGERDCGASVTDMFSDRGPMLRERIRAVWAKIKDLDPTAPECPI